MICKLYFIKVNLKNIVVNIFFYYVDKDIKDRKKKKFVKGQRVSFWLKVEFI